MFENKTYRGESAKFWARFSFIIFLVIALVFSACKSAGQEQGDSAQSQIKEPVVQEQKKSNQLTKYPDVMLWKIDGVAKDGTPSKVYLLGTYHAGDDRVSSFPQVVLNALEESDRFCCELSSSVWSELPDMMQSLTMKSFLTDLSHTLIDDMTEEEITLITQFIDPQSLAQLVCFEPWVLNNYLQPIAMLAADLDSQKAYDVMIMDYIARNKNSQTFDGLDDAQTQLDLIAYGDWDTQLTMLRDTLHDLENLQEAADEMTELYEVFLSGDEEAFEELYFKDFEKEIEKTPIYKDYFDSLLSQRNKDWAIKIADYLQEPGTTFVFAGCAHFVGDESVFAYMRQNGDLN